MVATSIASAVLVAASMALLWLAVSSTGISDPRPLQRHYLLILLYAYALFALPPLFRSRKRDRLMAWVGAGLLVLVLTVDLTCLRYFGEPFSRIYPFLPVQSGTATFDGVIGYARAYIPPFVALVAMVVVAAGMALAGRVRAKSAARWTLIALVPAAFVVAELVRTIRHGSDPTVAALIAEPLEAVKRIGPAPSQRRIKLVTANESLPRTIVLVIMESTGAAVPAADGKRPLSEAIIESSHAAGWVSFPQAVTNSNATDISVPTILTGTGAHEPRDKIQRMPLVSAYAAARDYDTAFITSSSLHWGGFDAFLSGGAFDTRVSADGSGLPFVNDLAVDDAYVYANAVRTIRAANGRLFLLLYPQSLHWPFQAKSKLPIPSDAASRRARAAGIAEAGFAAMFDALRETGRLDGALIIVTGDHGEFDYRNALRIPQMRLETFGEGVISPIFLVKPPVAMQGASLRALKQNRDQLVANTDIAPTIAHVLGARPQDDDFVGSSLFDEMPKDRTIFSSATNSWRAWPKSALAVSRGRERMLCEERELCRLAVADGGTLRFIRAAKPEDPLFSAALANRTMRRAMSAIYRGHYE